MSIINLVYQHASSIFYSACCPYKSIANKIKMLLRAYSLSLSEAMLTNSKKNNNNNNVYFIKVLVKSFHTERYLCTVILLKHCIVLNWTQIPRWKIKGKKMLHIT